MGRKHFITALEAPPSDIVVSTDIGTYIGTFDRSRYNPELDVEDQPIWSIRLIETPNDYTTRTLYPNGSELQVFVWNKKEEYNYQYLML